MAASTYSAAGAALGFGSGNSSIADQVAVETDEVRKRRLAAMQAVRVRAAYGDALSPAGSALGLGGCATHSTPLSPRPQQRKLRAMRRPRLLSSRR